MHLILDIIDGVLHKYSIFTFFIPPPHVRLFSFSHCHSLFLYFCLRADFALRFGATFSATKTNLCIFLWELVTAPTGDIQTSERKYRVLLYCIVNIELSFTFALSSQIAQQEKLGKVVLQTV